MELKSYLDSNPSFKDEVVKLAREVKAESMPKEFYMHSVKSIVEKYSAHFSRKAGKTVDPDQVNEISEISASAALKVAFLDESAEMGAASGAPKVSYEEISRTVDEYFEKHPEKLQDSGEGSVYHDVESEQEQPSEIIDGDMPAQDSNINQPRPTAF